MDFDFRKVEEKWRKEWERKDIYKVTEDTTRPKYYVLDMFPYPSGAGLHVGHPLGYVASDIYARYKRLKGFNVLHPMGYDAFGLPAEQYAIETGTPPEVTTEKAINTYRAQLDKIGFSYDWSREVKTSDPAYYKWTQWIFLQLFDSWYDREKNKAESIFTLFSFFAENGCINWPQHDKDDHPEFTDVEWNNFTTEQQQSILMHYRIAYQSFSEVNWCEGLGTVLANDEVKDGKSERGGYPVERRKMRQWFLRITEYADRLLSGLDTLDWSDAMKDMQRNWIGRSEGAIVNFHLPTIESSKLSKPRFYHTDSQTWSYNLKLAKQHRHDPTQEEEIVWQKLRANQIGFKIRRQHPIGQFIPDFVCIRKGLIIEIDGEIHEGSIHADNERTKTLAEYDFEVIRFKNEEVLSNIDKVINSIQAKLVSMPDKDYSEEDDALAPSPSERAGGEVAVFTTRPDTIYGATFMVIAPEHELIKTLTTPEQQKKIDDYITYVKSRTDVERQQEKRVTGAFTGSYAVNPFTHTNIPIYIAEYVLAGYGTGAIMAVPADDERDRKFAEKFGLPVIDVIDKSRYPGADIGDKVGTMINSGILDGKEVKDAIKTILDEIESKGIGKRKINYRLRDAGYSRQRYWGEPFPIVYKNDIPYPLPISELPVELPQVESYKPTGDGKAPLASNAAWINHSEGTRETDTMPGYAGSSWYFLRYMDPHNENAFASKEKLNYWQNVDLYLGGSEHAVGHLLYSRLWHKFLYDMGYVPTEEPFKKLVNQGMIQGVSQLLTFTKIEADKVKSFDLQGEDNFEGHEVIQYYGLVTKDFQSLNQRLRKESSKLFELDNVKYRVNNKFEVTNWHIPVKYVDSKGRISEEGLKELLKINYLEFPNIDFEKTVAWITEDDKRYIQCESIIEKMSKRYGNVVNPDEVIDKYGADAFRMFEMFLGPLDQSKPWDQQGIDGVSKFIRRFWRLFYDDKGNFKVTGALAPSPSERAGGEVTAAEYKSLHKTLKKVAEDIERLQFNTCISQFMICLNELTDLKCTKREILEPLLIALAPFAPFLTEELWQALGNTGSIHQTAYPAIEEKYLVESSFNYPVSINGKVRAEIPLALDLDEAAIKAAVLSHETISKWTNGAEPKKFIFVKGRIINVVV
jgi:leucyl-tRNA synthetase